MPIPAGTYPITGPVVGTGVRPTATAALYDAGVVFIGGGKVEYIERSGSVGAYTYAWRDYELDADALLDLFKATRVTGDRGKALGISSTDEDTLALLDLAAGDITGIDAGDGIRIDDGSTSTPEVNLDIQGLAAESTLQSGDEFAFADDSVTDDLPRKITYEDLLDQLAGVRISRNGTTLDAQRQITQITAFPTSPTTGEIVIFSADASSITALDTDGSTAITSAVMGDVFRRTTSNWQKIGTTSIGLIEAQSSVLAIWDGLSDPVPTTNPEWSAATPWNDDFDAATATTITGGSGTGAVIQDASVAVSGGNITGFGYATDGERGSGFQVGDVITLRQGQKSGKYTLTSADINTSFSNRLNNFSGKTISVISRYDDDEHAWRVIGDAAGELTDRNNPLFQDNSAVDWNRTFVFRYRQKYTKPVGGENGTGALQVFWGGNAWDSLPGWIGALTSGFGLWISRVRTDVGELDATYDKWLMIAPRPAGSVSGTPGQAPSDNTGFGMLFNTPSHTTLYNGALLPARSDFLASGATPTVSGGSGTGATVASITVSSGNITGVTWTSGGTGYLAGDALTITQPRGPSGVFGVANSDVSGGVLQNFTGKTITPADGSPNRRLGTGTTGWGRTDIGIFVPETDDELEMVVQGVGDYLYLFVNSTLYIRWDFSDTTGLTYGPRYGWMGDGNGTNGSIGLIYNAFVGSPDPINISPDRPPILSDKTPEKDSLEGAAGVGIRSSRDDHEHPRTTLFMAANYAGATRTDSQLKQDIANDVAQGETTNDESGRIIFTFSGDGISQAQHLYIFCRERLIISSVQEYISGAWYSSGFDMRELSRPIIYEDESYWVYRSLEAGTGANAPTRLRISYTFNDNQAPSSGGSAQFNTLSRVVENLKPLIPYVADLRDFGQNYDPNADASIVRENSAFLKVIDYLTGDPTTAYTRGTSVSFTEASMLTAGLSSGWDKEWALAIPHNSATNLISSGTVAVLRTNGNKIQVNDRRPAVASGSRAVYDFPIAVTNGAGTLSAFPTNAEAPGRSRTLEIVCQISDSLGNVYEHQFSYDVVDGTATQLHQFSHAPGSPTIELAVTFAGSANANPTFTSQISGFNFTRDMTNSTAEIVRALELLDFITNANLAAADRWVDLENTSGAAFTIPSAGKLWMHTYQDPSDTVAHAAQAVFLADGGTTPINLRFTRSAHLFPLSAVALTFGVRAWVVEGPSLHTTYTFGRDLIVNHQSEEWCWGQEPRTAMSDRQITGEVDFTGTVKFGGLERLATGVDAGTVTLTAADTWATTMNTPDFDIPSSGYGVLTYVIGTVNHASEIIDYAKLHTLTAAVHGMASAGDADRIAVDSDTASAQNSQLFLGRTSADKLAVAHNDALVTSVTITIRNL